MQPPIADKHQRRQERRRLIKLGTAALTSGFSNDLDDEIPVGVLMMLHDMLSDKSNSARAGEAAELAEQVVERSNVSFERQPDVACKRGCYYCCVTVVSVTPPEVFRVAAWIRKNRMNSPTLSPTEIEKRCRSRMGLSKEETFRLKTPCPMLVNGECGVHSVRPINCRQFLSTSVAVCIESFGGTDAPVPFVGGALDRGTLARSLLTGAMKAAGFPDTAYELCGALTRALGDEESEAKWLSGLNVFEGVLETPRPKTTQDFIDHCAQFVEQKR